jgi:hypothetical protein
MSYSTRRKVRKGMTALGLVVGVAVVLLLSAGTAVPQTQSTLDVYLYKQFYADYGPDPSDDSVPIGVRVYNPGPETETGVVVRLENLSLAKTIGMATIGSLSPESSSTVYINWDTAGLKGTYALQATAEAPPDASSTSAIEDYVLAPRLVIVKLASSELVYPPKASVFVYMTVTDPGGNPLEGAYCRINIDPPSGWRVWCTGWTGPDGKFGSFFDHEMKFGTGTFRVDAYAWSPDYARAEAQTSFDVLKQAVEEPVGTGTIKGTVTYPDGSPAKRATVGALRLSDLYMTQNVYTKAGGRYTLENVPPGDYLVLAYIWNTSWNGEKVVTVHEGAVVTGDIVLKE